MKISYRLIGAVLAAALLLSLAACSGGNAGPSGDESSSIPQVSGAPVLRYGDLTMDEYDYMFIASLIKDSIVYSQQSYMYQMTGTVYEAADILNTEYEEGHTIADYIKDYILEFARQMIIIEKLCADAGIDITDQSALDEISSRMNDLEYAYGGSDLFDIALTRMGLSRKAIERYYRLNYLYSLYSEYRYGDNGVTPIAESAVNEYFLDNYYRYEGAVFPFTDSDGNEIVFEYTDDEVKDYFYGNYVKVAHVLYKTVDTTTSALTPYSDEKIAEQEAKAKAALEAIESGEKTHADFKEENEDGNYEYVFTHGRMVSEFESAAYEMEPGEVRLVKTTYGYHIMLKEELGDTDLYGTSGEDGAASGGMVSDIKTEMSQKKIKELADWLYGSLSDGSVKEFPESIDGFDGYSYNGPSLIDKNGSYSSLASFIASVGEGEVVKSDELSYDAEYVIRRLPLTAENITESIRADIVQDKTVTAFMDYVSSFYDDVEVNQESVDKFDIYTLPALEDEFYQ